MEADKRFTACRLCLCPSEVLIGVFDYQDGYTPAEVITELLRFEVSMGDIYPQCVCDICMGKLTDFKKFKELCCVFKASIDRAYAAKHVSAPETTSSPAEWSPVPCKIEKIIPVEGNIEQDLAVFSREQPIPNAGEGEVIFPDDPTDLPLISQYRNSVTSLETFVEKKPVFATDVHPVTLTPARPLGHTDTSSTKNAEMGAPAFSEATDEELQDSDDKKNVFPHLTGEDPNRGLSLQKFGNVEPTAALKDSQTVEEVSGTGSQPTPSTSNIVLKESCSQPSEVAEGPTKVTRSVARSMAVTPAQKMERKAKRTREADSDDDTNDLMDDQDNSSSDSFADGTVAFSNSSDDELMPAPSKTFKGAVPEGPGAMPTLSSVPASVQGKFSEYPSAVENDKTIAEKYSGLPKSQGSNHNFPHPLESNGLTVDKPAMASSSVEAGKITSPSSSLQSGKSTSGKVNIIVPKESLLMERFFVPPDEVNRLLPATLMDAISNNQTVESLTSKEDREMISHPGPGESLPNRSNAVVPGESVPDEALESQTNVSSTIEGKADVQKGDTPVPDSMAERTETLSESKRSTSGMLVMRGASTSAESLSAPTSSRDVEQAVANAQMSSGIKVDRGFVPESHTMLTDKDSGKIDYERSFAICQAAVRKQMAASSVKCSPQSLSSSMPNELLNKILPLLSASKVTSACQKSDQMAPKNIKISIPQKSLLKNLLSQDSTRGITSNKKVCVVVGGKDQWLPVPTPVNRSELKDSNTSSELDITDVHAPVVKGTQARSMSVLVAVASASDKSETKESNSAVMGESTADAEMSKGKKGGKEGGDFSGGGQEDSSSSSDDSDLKISDGDIDKKKDGDPQVSKELMESSGSPVPSTSNVKASSSQMCGSIENPRENSRRVTRSMLADPSKKKVKSKPDVDSDIDSSKWWGDSDDSSSSFSAYGNDTDTCDSSDKEVKPKPAKKSKVDRDFVPESRTKLVDKDSGKIDYERSLAICQAAVRKQVAASSVKCSPKSSPSSMPNEILKKTLPLLSATASQKSDQVDPNKIERAVPQKSILMNWLSQDSAKRKTSNKKVFVVVEGKGQGIPVPTPVNGSELKDSNTSSALDIANLHAPVVKGKSAGSKSVLAVASTSGKSETKESNSAVVGVSTAKAEMSKGKKGGKEGDDFSGSGLDDTSSSSDDSDWKLSDEDTNKKKHGDGSLLKSDKFNEEYSPSDKVFHCSICGKTYMQWRTWKAHLDGHKYGKRFKCDACGKGFISKTYLLLHMTCHETELKFKCDVCGKAYKSYQILKHHKQIHGEKRFMCELCGRKFFIEFRLKEHLLIHNKEKKYPCDVCGKCFYAQWQVKAHHKIVHLGEKNYKHRCDQCDKLFPSPASLKNHMMIHTGERPYTCSVCGFRVRMKSQLESHMNTHTREKNYKCDLCDAVFAQKTGMLRHRQRHSGGKDYKCDQCGKQYTQSHNLKNHKMKGCKS